MENLKDKKQSEKNDVFCKSFRNYFREYCVCSSIHGFRYFGEKRTYFERFWWFTVFSLVLASCIYLLRQTYQKWERSPVIVSFATSETPIYSIPFPAVTICPESKTKQSLYNSSDILDKLDRKIPLNNTEIESALYMSLICDEDYISTSNLRRLKYLRRNLSFSDEQFLNFIDKVHVNKDFMIKCKWMGNSTLCKDLFLPILTDEGICYTFNMLDREDIFKKNVVHFKDFLQYPVKENLTWNLDDGYVKEDDIETYPRRALYAGVETALDVSLVTNKNDIDHSCKDSLQGFRVLLHTPMRVPRASQQYFRIPLDEVVLGAIHPVLISTSETVQVYNPKRRECYFPIERNLKYFKIYTQLNCHLECLTNFTLDVCGCVNYYMPRFNNTKICSAAKTHCMRSAELKLQEGNLERKLQELRKDSNNNSEQETDIRTEINMEKFNEVPKCNCMPICTDLTYNVETSQASWNWHEKHRFLHANETHMSRLILYFKTSQFVSSKRHELYGPTDFLANFGGLLGLFTGFSILSLMELIYFLTVRLCCNVRLFGAWYGPSQN